jgi:drug/metabolite transporter (DMT)-like permease
VLAVVLALVSALGYGGSDFAAGLASREVSAIRVTIISESVSVAVLLLIAPWMGAPSLSAVSVSWSVAAGLGGVGGALALYLGFTRAAFSVGGPVSAVASAAFSVVAGLGFGEHPGTLAMIGIALALPAIVAVSITPAEPGSASPLAGAAYGLVAGAGFAMLFIGLNRAGGHSGLWPVLISQCAALAAIVAVGAARRDLGRLPGRPAGLGALTGATGVGGTICYFIATHHGLLAVTAVITSLYPASTILLARLLLAERLTWIRLCGLVLAGASVALIAASGRG